MGTDVRARRHSYRKEVPFSKTYDSQKPTTTRQYPGIGARHHLARGGNRSRSPKAPDLVEALRSIGIFRMFVFQSHGGLELDLPAALEIFGALSRIDGSVGWISMIGGAHWREPGSWTGLK